MAVFALPAYVTGKHCSLMTVVPLTFSADGLTYTPGTALNLKGLAVFDHFKYSANAVGVEKHPADGTVANNVALYDDFEIEIGEIGQPSVLGNLAVAWGSGTHFRVEADTLYPGSTTTAKLAALVTRVNGSLEYEILDGVGMWVARLKPCGTLPYYGTGTPPF